MVLDTSAVAAVILGEPDAEGFLAVMQANVGDVQMSAATWVECAIVVEARQGKEAVADFRLLQDRLALEIVPLDDRQAEMAVVAWRRFGMGRHPAALNLGDCFSYALSKLHGAALLFNGEDFPQTDVASAW